MILTWVLLVLIGVRTMDKETRKTIRKIQEFIGTYQSLNEMDGRRYYRRRYYALFPYWRLEE